ncbi:MAG: hypothetical protein HY876_10460 [Coriobacteriales bacterium]|nr:hypothetical protein [Coriobacteriales bacterium]
MDCIQAQELISTALDREPVDPQALAEAKSHCRECADCVRFVRGLAALQRAIPPEPPAELANAAAKRAREVVDPEREAAAQAAAAAAEAAVVAEAAAGEQPAEAAAATAPLPAVEITAQDVRPKIAPRRRTGAIIGWAAAAAVLVLFGAWAAVAGVRAIFAPREAGAPQTAQTERSVPLQPGTGDTATEGGATAPQAQQKGEESAGPQYVDFDGTVYRFQSETGESSATAQRIGTALTSLDGGSAATSRDVYGSRGGEMILIANDAGVMLSFAPVTRQYGGVTYRLRSTAIPAFGVWPALPQNVAQPTAADGSPTFVVEADEGGVTVYRLAGSSAREGIAVGPGSPQSDPAAGNPNWTWWTP